MNIIKKFFSFIKNIFTKKDEVKKLEPSHEIEEHTEHIERNRKDEFLKSLQVTTVKKKKRRNKVETYVIPGCGLGIKNKFSS